MAGLRTDRDLLRDYAAEGSESAFQALVERHLDLVFATALRGLNETGAAQEISQDVFVALARKAAWLSGRTSLAGWLHKRALLEVRRWWRGELRRQRREQAAVELGTVMKDEDSLLKALAGELDEGLLELREADRQAVLLRYFEGRSHREIGALLGAREDAVRKRIDKALGQLTHFFRRRGYAVPAAAATAGAISATAKAAPAGLAIATTRSALTATGSGLLGCLKPLLARLMGLSTGQTAIVCLAVAAAPVLWEWTVHRMALNRAASASLQMAGPRTAVRDGAVNVVGRPQARWAEAPFHWSEIESSDYRQYVANLRAIGCPEQVIRDIVFADLNELYAARSAAIWKPTVPAYWQKPTAKRDNPGPEQKKQLAALAQEQAEIAKELTGSRLDGQTLAETPLLLLQGSELQLLFLPEDKRLAALQALSEAGVEDEEASLQMARAGLGGPGAKPQAANVPANAESDLFDHKLQVLASVLSPEELEEFTLYNSPVAQALRVEARFFDLTPEEFKALVDLRQQRGGGESPYSDLLNRAAAVEDARQVLGDDRAKEFDRATDLVYVTARVASENAGLPAEAADQAWQVSHDARMAADQVAGDASLSVQERKDRIQTLEQNAEAALSLLMGEQAARPVCRNLRSFLTATSIGVRP